MKIGSTIRRGNTEGGLLGKFTGTMAAIARRPTLLATMGAILLSASLGWSPVRAAAAGEAGAPPADVELVASYPLAHVPGKAITTVRVSYPPGGKSKRHHHGGAVSVYVVSGAVRSQISGEPARVYKAGESFFEPPGVRHLVSENASDLEPAELLAVFVAAEGETLTRFDE